MAQTITNLATRPDGFVASPPIARVTVADQSASTSTQDLGVAGLQFARARIRLKTFTGGTTPMLTFQLQVDNDSGFASPEVIAVSGTFTTVSGADAINCDIAGWSNTGFQYAKLVLAYASGSGGTISYDAIIEAC